MRKNNIIELHNIFVGYKDLIVLEDISINIPRGSFLAVVGPNGGGKTTLIKTILGLIKPGSGTVNVFGKPAYCQGGNRKKIGYVPQVLSIDANFPIHAKDVVLMGRYGRIGLLKNPALKDKKIAKETMDKIGILELADKPIGRLSGGQRQRVFLARALANEPEILFLDEPTTGIDVPSTEGLYELLHKLHNEGITIIIVSHDIGVVASYVDTIACLNKRLIAHGRPEEVINPENLEKMYGCDAMLLFHHHTPHIAVRKH